MTDFDTSGDVGPMPPGPMNERFMKWSDLNAFTQGYVEALFAGLPTKYRNMVDGGCMAIPRLFSDLAPETRARIIAECETALESHLWSNSTVDGALFWTERNGEFNTFAGASKATVSEKFPPLTVQLGDDGKVRFA